MPLNIEVFNKELYDILDVGQDLEIVAQGFEFIEGPIWNNKNGYLTFSDIPASRIYRWHKDVGVTLLADQSNKPNGNCYDKEGKILTCEHATSRICSRNDDGTGYKVLISHYNGLELNSPNDIVVKSDGSIYFTDPRFGRNPSRVGVPREQQLPFQGVFRYKPVTNELTLLADDFMNPNGLCFSSDEKLLFVNDSPRKHIRVFEIKDDGTIENSRVWADTLDRGPGLPDGIKVDTLDNVYCCAQGGMHIFNKNGEYLGILYIPGQAANFTWGDDNLSSIYITATDTLFRIRVKIPGIRNYIW